MQRFLPTLPSTRWRLGLLGLFALICAWLHPSSASAHAMPYTAIMLDFGHGGVSAELILPLQELELGFKQPLLSRPGEVLPKDGPALNDYLLAHVHPTAPDGRPWTVTVSDLRVQAREQPFDLVAHVWMQPPPGAPLRQFRFNYDVIVHEVVSHKAFVFVRNDWNEARFRSTDQVPPMPEAVGLIRYLVYSVDINRTGGSFWRGFGSVLLLGVQHIAGGLDHLLFLFALLLPAPLLPAGNRWGAFRGLKGSFVQLLKIVTAFTLGHSLTLLIGGMGWLRLPQRPVEILIAVSILVSSIHAIRPIFAGKEPWVAGGFGLVHGLAFSTSIAQFGFSPWHLVMTILGFNLGIELMQLAVVVMIVPLLIILSRSQTYTPTRLTGATLAAVAALVWIGARIDFWKKDPGVASAAVVQKVGMPLRGTPLLLWFRATSSPQKGKTGECLGEASLPWVTTACYAACSEDLRHHNVLQFPRIKPCANPVPPRHYPPSAGCPWPCCCCWFPRWPARIRKRAASADS